MNKQNFLYYVKRFAAPVILLLLGMVLTFSPDSATTLLVQIIGWVLIAAAAALAMGAITIPGAMVSKVIGAVLCGCSGIWMVTNPLSLAAWLGRIIGFLLLLQGLQNIIYQKAMQNSLFLPVLTAVVGAVLVALPMTTSRLVFTIAGIVVMIIGGIMLAQRIHDRRNLQEPEDPNIIDAL